jgi:RES domain
VDVSSLPGGTILWRVHPGDRSAITFNASQMTLGRFSPVQGSAGSPVGVWYGGHSADVAIAETLLHDLPRVGGRLLPEQYLDRVLSPVVVSADLQVAVLHGHGLRRLGVRATQLTDTDPAAYPITVRWAEAIRRAAPEISGLEWMSRQHNSDRAVALFEDRVALSALTPGAGLSFASHDGLDLLADVCQRAGVALILPT